MDRLYYEKYTSLDDYYYYKILVSNEDIMNMNYGRIFTPEEIDITFKRIMKHSSSEYSCHYKVFLKDSTYIGYCSLILNESLTEGEIEYMLLPQFWGNGYATEMVSYLETLSTKIITLNKLTAFTDPNNVSSQKILLKNNYKSVKKFKIDDGSWAEIFEKNIVKG